MAGVNAGRAEADDFADVNKMIDLAKGGNARLKPWRLLACYLIA